MSSRRDFLQKVTLSAVGLPLLSFKNAPVVDDFYTQPYDGPVLRVAIMGLGSYGTRVAEAIQAC